MAIFEHKRLTNREQNSAIENFYNHSSQSDGSFYSGRPSLEYLINTRSRSKPRMRLSFKTNTTNDPSI